MRHAVIISVLSLTHFAMASGGGPEQPPDALLPVLTTGDLPGAHAVYRHDKFDAVIDAAGVLRLYLRGEDNYVGQPVILCRPGGRYYHKTKQTIVDRPVVRFYDPPPPSWQPAAVRLQGIIAGGMGFYVSYSFDGSAIAVRGGCIDAGGPPRRTQFVLVSRFAPIYGDSEGGKMPEGSHSRETARTFSRYRLETREYVDGKPRQYSYAYLDPGSFHGPLHELDVKGPWGPRRLRLRTRGMVAQLSAAALGDQLADGYEVHYFEAEAITDRKRGELIFQVY